MNSRFAIFVVPLFVLTANAGASPRAKADHATVELISEKNSFAPGSRAWVGVAITHEPNWHTYWINPGDSGLPTKLEWTLPQDFRAGDIAWPAPKRFDLGGLYNFGYDGTAVLLVPIDVPASAKSGSSATIAVNAKWLICSHEICLPGKASLDLSVPVANGKPDPNPIAAPLFAVAQTKLPRSAGWPGAAKISRDRIHIELGGSFLPRTEHLDVFSATPNVVENGPPKVGRVNERIVVDVAKSEYLETVPRKLTLILSETAREPPIAWMVDVPLSSTSEPSSTSQPTNASKTN